MTSLEDAFLKVTFTDESLHEDDKSAGLKMYKEYIEHSTLLHSLCCVCLAKTLCSLCKDLEHGYCNVRPLHA